MSGFSAQILLKGPQALLEHGKSAMYLVPGTSGKLTMEVHPSLKQGLCFQGEYI